MQLPYLSIVLYVICYDSFPYMFHANCSQKLGVSVAITLEDF
jgi:hypothetical protein